MKNKISNSILILFLVSVTTSCKYIENNKVASYYKEIKPSIEAKNKLIRSLIQQQNDLPETDDAAEIDKMPDIDKIMISFNSKDLIKSKLYPLNDDKTMTCTVEEFTNKEANTFYQGAGVIHCDFATNNIARIADVGNIDGERFLLKNFKEDVAKFLQAEYLVISDCVFAKSPSWLGDTRVNPGLILKKITIYNLNNKTVADSYYLTINGTNKVTNTKERDELRTKLQQSVDDAIRNSLFSRNY